MNRSAGRTFYHQIECNINHIFRILNANVKPALKSVDSANYIQMIAESKAIESFTAKACSPLTSLEVQVVL